ncbi:MAG: sigma factor-like helix-turn-helix DNA-binding protein, partial [Flavobacteriales bacterium]
LPADQKEVLKMRMYFEMSFKDIAEETNVSINTALGRMRYALINLRKMADERNIQLTMI